MAVLFLASSMLSDLILPFLALEQSSARSAFTHAFSLIRAEPASFLGFITFQILLACTGLVAQYAVALVSSLLAAIPLLLLALAGYALLHTVLSPLLLTVAGVLLYFIFIVITMYLQLGSLGILMIFLRAYSLLFLGGRYRPLGDRLYPTAPPPPFAGPRSFPPFPASTSRSVADQSGPSACNWRTGSRLWTGSQLFASQNLIRRDSARRSARVGSKPVSYQSFSFYPSVRVNPSLPLRIYTS